MCKCRNKGSTYSVDTLYGFKTSPEDEGRLLQTKHHYLQIGCATQIVCHCQAPGRPTEKAERSTWFMVSVHILMVPLWGSVEWQNIKAASKCETSISGQSWGTETERTQGTNVWLWDASPGHKSSFSKPLDPRESKYCFSCCF